MMLTFTQKEWHKIGIILAEELEYGDTSSKLRSRNVQLQISLNNIENTLQNLPDGYKHLIPIKLNATSITEIILTLLEESEIE